MSSTVYWTSHARGNGAAWVSERLQLNIFMLPMRKSETSDNSICETLHKILVCPTGEVYASAVLGQAPWIDAVIETGPFPSET